MGHMTAKVAVAKAIYAIDRPYDYRVPRELEGRLRPGMRVLVPFGAGNRGSDGVVLALSREGAEGGLKDVTAALDDRPVLDEKLLKLALWMRERYFCTVYDAVKAMLPAGLYYALRDCVALRSGVDRAAALRARRGVQSRPEAGGAAAGLGRTGRHGTDPHRLWGQGPGRRHPDAD